jgi:glucose-1-phosphate adenylyltransferase
MRCLQQQRAQARQGDVRSSAVPSFGSSVCGSSGRVITSVQRPVNGGARQGAPVTRSRKVAAFKAVLEKPTIQYTDSSRAKSTSVLAIILGGGAGTRLFPLTKQRAKPAVPIGGAYRLIDVPMSNCINSGVSKIYILTQYNSTSLNRHLARTYNMGAGVRFGGEGFVEVLAATQTPTDKEWFQGTADAVRQYSWLLTDTKNRSIEDVIILSGDHLYRMDYMKFVDYHRAQKADITIGCIPYGYDRASEFGLMKVDDQNNVIQFAEKPKGAELEAMKVDTQSLGLDPEEAKEKPFIASMGIYVFKKKVLAKLLNEEYTKSNDFGGQIIPNAAGTKTVKAYLFSDYWEDIGTIRSFFDENLKLARHNAPFEFYDPSSPIYTSPRFLPPAKIENCDIKEAIISHGAFVRDSIIDHAVVGLRSHVEKNCVIKNALIIGADYYESDEEREAVLKAGGVPLGIGENSHIENTIADKNARIGRNVHISNKDGVEEANHEERGFHIRSGIVCVTRGAVIPDGTVI